MLGLHTSTSPQGGSKPARVHAHTGPSACPPLPAVCLPATSTAPSPRVAVWARMKSCWAMCTRAHQLTPAACLAVRAAALGLPAWKPSRARQTAACPSARWSGTPCSGRCRTECACRRRWAPPRAAAATGGARPPEVQPAGAGGGRAAVSSWWDGRQQRGAPPAPHPQARAQPLLDLAAAAAHVQHQGGVLQQGRHCHCCCWFGRAAAGCEALRQRRRSAAQNQAPGRAVQAVHSRMGAEWAGVGWRDAQCTLASCKPLVVAAGGAVAVGAASHTASIISQHHQPQGGRSW